MRVFRKIRLCKIWSKNLNFLSYYKGARFNHQFLVMSKWVGAFYPDWAKALNDYTTIKKLGFKVGVHFSHEQVIAMQGVSPFSFRILYKRSRELFFKANPNKRGSLDFLCFLITFFLKIRSKFWRYSRFRVMLWYQGDAFWSFF